jgi:hypothetical protein
MRAAEAVMDPSMLRTLLFIAAMANGILAGTRQLRFSDGQLISEGRHNVQRADFLGRSGGAARI